MTTTEARPGDKAPAITVKGWKYTEEFFPAGQHTPGSYPGQRADVLARHTGTFALDLDLYKDGATEKWEPSATRAWIGDRLPYIKRGDKGSLKYLIIVSPEIAAEWWPVAGGLGWGEIRSAGIIPSAGSLHPSGDTYDAVPGPDLVRYPDGQVIMTNVIWLDPAGIEALAADGAKNKLDEDLVPGDAELPRDDGRCPEVGDWLANRGGADYFAGATPRGERANGIVNYLKILDARGHLIGGWIDEIAAMLPETSEADFAGMWASAPVPAGTIRDRQYCCRPPEQPPGMNGQPAPFAEIAQLAAGQAPDLLARRKNGAYLNSTTFAPLHYHVNGLVPEGLTVLTGAPKIGKSWLALGWLLKLAVAGNAVMYFALEDSDRRMQWRCRQLGYDPVPETFEYMTEEDVVPGMLLPTVAQFVRENYDRKPLIVVDTLAKAMQQTPRIRDEAQYERDYRVTNTLQSLVLGCPGAGLVICHHDRKAGGDDWVDKISGTKGITGGPDAVMYLERKRNEEPGALHVTGKDIAENDYAMMFRDGCRWELDGATMEAAAAAYLARKAETGLGERSAQIVALAHERGTAGIRAEDAAVAADISPHQAAEYLRRLEGSGRLRKSGRGLYMCVCCVCSPPLPDETPLSNTLNTHHPTEYPAPRSGVSRPGLDDLGQPIPGYEWKSRDASERHADLLARLTRQGGVQ